MNSTIIIFPNEALAIKAKRLLRTGGISARITGVTDSADGCKKGLILSEEGLSAAVRLLRDNGVEYTLTLI